MRALCLFLFAALLSAAEAQCKPATLPTAGSSLKCYSGTTGGSSAGPPTAETSGFPGFDYCVSYTFACTSTDSGTACTGQPTGTLVRAFVPVGASTAAAMISPSSAFARRFDALLLSCASKTEIFFPQRNSTLFFTITIF